MRNAVREQTEAFRRTGPQRCACRGAERHGSPLLQVDHVEPFKHLVVGFQLECSKAGLQPPTKFARTPRTNLDCFAGDPADQEFTRRWQAYHRRHARLQLLCKPCHSEKTSRQMRATRRRKP